MFSSKYAGEPPEVDERYRDRCKRCMYFVEAYDSGVEKFGVCTLLADFNRDGVLDDIEQVQGSQTCSEGRLK